MNSFYLKKIVAIFIVVGTLFTVIPRTYAENEKDVKKYIVILEEPALYSDERPQLFNMNGAEYKNEVRRALTQLQEDIKAQIPAPMKLFNDEEQIKEYSYTDVLNGFTVTTDEDTAEFIKNIEGVSEVFADEVIAYASEAPDIYLQSEAVTTEESEFSAANPGNEINVQYAYEKGYNGKGRTVAILDSNINYNNSYFALTDETAVKYTEESLAAKIAEKGMGKDTAQAYKNAKIPYVYDYVKNTYTITSSSSQHGTHVSGIAAGFETTVGDGKITGIVPEAQIMFFGVTASNGSISFSVVAAALDDAVKLEADAINMSFGADYYSENRPGTALNKFRVAARNAKNAGCLISKSAGNMNKGGAIQTKEIDYSASDNILFPHVANIGSVHGKYRVAKGLTDENGVVYGSESKSSSSKFDLSEIVDCKSGETSEINALDISGKAAVITIPDELLRESDVTYYNRVVSKGAEALILVNNSNQVAVSSVSSYYKIPVFYMTKSEGEKMLTAAKQISCFEKLTISENSKNVVPSINSSYGYSDTLDISVDYSSPGGNIHSAYGSSVTGMSGTSMAAPGASGASILMYQYFEEKYPQYTGNNKAEIVKNLLASTAETVYEENGTIASPRKVGSGIIQLDKAMQSRVLVYSSDYKNKITLGDEIGKEFSFSFYVENISDSPVTFDKVEAELSTDDYKYYESKDIYAFCGLKKLNATVNGTESITVQPESKEQVTLTVTLNEEDINHLEKAMVNGFFVDGKVTLSNNAGEHVSVGIPFTGFYGDWEQYTPVNEDNMNTDFLFSTKMNYATVENKIKQSEEGYILPFTTDPDEFVENSALSLIAQIRRNTFVRIKADDEVIYDAFAPKRTSLNLNTFVTKNGAVSETLKTNGKVVWEFYFMSPLHKTESEAQVIKITVIPQNEKPEFKAIQIKDTDEKKICVEVDGKDISSIICIGHKNGIKTVLRSNNSKTAEFSVGELSDASFIVYDEALNSAAENHGVTMTVENNKVKFKNNTLEPLYFSGILASYTVDGKIEKIEFLNKDCPTLNEYEKIEKDISAYVGKKYRIFYWKDSLTPLQP